MEQPPEPPSFAGLTIEERFTVLGAYQREQLEDDEQIRRQRVGQEARLAMAKAATAEPIVQATRPCPECEATGIYSEKQDCAACEGGGLLPVAIPLTAFGVRIG